eukprot:5032120-Amphidinium_carterae.1
MATLSNKTRLYNDWKRILFQELFGQLIAAGEACSDEVAHLAKMAKTKYEAQDLLDLDHVAAATLGEACSCLRALEALLNPAMGAEAEAKPRVSAQKP